MEKEDGNLILLHFTSVVSPFSSQNSPGSFKLKIRYQISLFLQYFPLYLNQSPQSDNCIPVFLSLIVEQICEALILHHSTIQSLGPLVLLEVVLLREHQLAYGCHTLWRIHDKCHIECGPHLLAVLPFQRLFISHVNFIGPVGFK